MSEISSEDVLMTFEMVIGIIGIKMNEMMIIATNYAIRVKFVIIRLPSEFWRIRVELLHPSYISQFLRN